MRDPADNRTIQLAALATTDNEPQLVAHANLSDLRIRLSASGTSNKKVFLAVRQNDVRDPGNAAVTPTGYANCYVMTVGDKDTLYLSRGQSLYAIADGTGVFLSVNAIGEDLGFGGEEGDD